ncbi:MAG: DUF721 domain-containing protein [Cyanobacteria bacterium P01_F01_bin.153]
MGNFDSISHILANVEQNPHWQTRQQLRRIREHWEAIAGETVARHTRPVALQNQQLKIATASNSWSQNLMFERQRLLQKLNRHFQNPPLTPPIKELYFSTARWSQNQPSRPKSSTPQFGATEEPARQSINKSTTDESAKDAIESDHPFEVSPADTPAQAFQNWAQQRQRQTYTSPPCPICTAPTPPQELQRWQCCSLCATHRWRT